MPTSFVSNEQKEFIKHNWDKMTVGQIASITGLPRNSIHTQANRFGLPTHVSMRHNMTPSDARQYIKDHWGDMTLDEISENTSYNKQFIRRYAVQFGLLPKPPERMKRSKQPKSPCCMSRPDIEQYIKDHWYTMSYRQICEAIGISYDKVKHISNKLGMGPKPLITRPKISKG